MTVPFSPTSAPLRHENVLGDPTIVHPTMRAQSRPDLFPQYRNRISGSMPACRVCHDLDFSNDTSCPITTGRMDYPWKIIEWNKVRLAAINGCSACSMLVSGISRLQGPLDGYEKIRLRALVDRAAPLRVYVYTEGDPRVGSSVVGHHSSWRADIYEFYTHVCTFDVPLCSFH